MNRICTKRRPATIATMIKNRPQWVSSWSVLRMLGSEEKAMSGRKTAAARSPVTTASFRARVTAAWVAPTGASATISHLLDVRPAEEALRQEDQGDGKDGEDRDVLVVDGEIGRPHGFDHANYETADHRAGQ